jgi:hypothetical protein
MKTMDKVIALGLALGAIAMGVAALGAGSAAALPTTTGANGYKMAEFKVEVEGTQTATMHRTLEAKDPCSTSDFSTGREVLKFHTEHPVIVTAFDSPGGGFNPEFFVTHQVTIPTVATLDRSFTPVFGPPPTNPECGENGGMDESYVPPTPDCGTRHLDFPVKLQYSRTKHDGLLLSSGLTDETLYELCPQTASIESFPWLLVEKGGGHGNYITADLSQKNLFDPDFQQWISLANGSKKRVHADEWHKTSIHWSVSFTRLKE